MATFARPRFVGSLWFRCWVGLVFLIAPFQTLFAQVEPLQFSPVVVPDADEGVFYDFRFALRGGVSPYVFTAVDPAQLPPGLSVDGTLFALRGTPTLHGSYTFQLRLADSTGTGTFTKSITMRVAAPIVLSPATLPTAMVGQSYREVLTASGGVAPYRFAYDPLQSRLPPGISLSSDGTISGRLTEVDTNLYSQIMVIVTDATGAEKRQAYQIKTIYPSFPITPAVMPVGQIGAPYSQQLSASGGTPPYRFIPIKDFCPKAGASGLPPPPPPCDSTLTINTQNALPPGLRMDPNGLISGVPLGPAGTRTVEFLVVDANYAGNVLFTSRGYLADSIKQVQITIASGGLQLSPTLPDGTAGSIYRQVISATGGTGAARFSLSSGALPPGITLASDGTLAGLPTTPGSYDFVIAAVDGSTPAKTGAMQYRVTIAGSPVTSVHLVASTWAGVPVRVVLTDGAVGGPFTGASIVSISPANAGITAIETIIGASGPIYRLVFTPSPSFTGQAQLLYTLSTAAGNSLPQAIDITVSARPDPSLDPAVRALERAQIDAARRFVSMQSANFGRRLERLHDDTSRRPVEAAIGLSMPMSCAARASARDGAHAGCAGDGVLALGNAQPRGSASDAGSDWSMWFSGTLRSGDQDGRNGGVTHFDFETDGISVGADRRIDGALAIGGGAGWAHDRSALSDEGSRSIATARTVAIYASYHPGERWFLDGLFGWQSVDFDLRRRIAANGATVQGSRSGGQWFGGITFGADIRDGAWHWMPYARTDFARGRLDGYVEHGDPAFALAYDDADLDSLSADLGLRVGYRLDTRWGMFEPEARMEYQHDFRGVGATTLQYADMSTGPVYRIEGDGFDRNRFGYGLGLRFEFQRGWGLHVDYRGEAGDGSRTDQAVRVDVDKRF